MSITVEAIYENGVLWPAQPLPWKDGERVCVTVSSLDRSLLTDVENQALVGCTSAHLAASFSRCLAADGSV
jgi:predicted DNA-binding antitoxin AbrB/MazE fold protein